MKQEEGESGQGWEFSLGLWVLTILQIDDLQRMETLFDRTTLLRLREMPEEVTQWITNCQRYVGRPVSKRDVLSKVSRASVFASAEVVERMLSYMGML